MEYDEDYLVTLVMLHGGRIWQSKISLKLDHYNGVTPTYEADWFVFEPGWDENKPFSLGHTRFGNSRFEAVKRYCLWKELIS